MPESKRVKEIFQQYCEFQGSLELFAETHSINLKSCTNWAVKYNWESRKATIVAEGKLLYSDHLRLISDAHADLLKDCDRMRATTLDLMGNLEKCLRGDGTILDPDKSASTLVSAIAALARCHELKLEALGVGELVQKLHSYKMP